MSIGTDLAEQGDDYEYMMIENQGVSGEDLLMTLGATTSRGDDGQIGQFGSGTKFAIALLIRAGVKFRIYTGKQGYEPHVERKETKDILGDRVVLEKVCLRGVGGPSKKVHDLNVTVGLGELDWGYDPGLALREFVSNAADGSMKLSGDYKACKIRHVRADQVRGEEGLTRVFVELTPEVQAWDVNKHFLIFGHEYDPKDKIMEKRKGDPLRVYRRGVLVGEFPGYGSLWDYNFPDIHVNEARIITSEDAQSAVGSALQGASEAHLRRWFAAVMNHEDVFERTRVSMWYLRLHDEDVMRIDVWKRAFDSAFGGAGVVCTTPEEKRAIVKKGYQAVEVSTELRNALGTFRLRQAGDILDHFEVSGRVEYALSAEDRERVSAVWGLLVEQGLTRGRSEMPSVEGFREEGIRAGGTTFAYYDESRDTVGISADALEGDSQLAQVLLAEFGQAILGSGDPSRLQDWAFEVAGVVSARILST